jgi:hypothetical protein
MGQMNKYQIESFDRLVNLLMEVSGVSKEAIEQLIEDRAKYVALPSSQAAISKAEAKRQRKAAKLQQQQGVA